MPLITGTIQDESTGVYVGLVEFENLDAPCVGGANITGPNIHAVVTGSLGALPAGLSLAPGRTRLIVNGRKSKTFTIPDLPGSFDLNALMSAPSSTLTTRVIVTAATIADLREYASSSSNLIAHVLADSNGAYAVYKWDPAATNVDEPDLYIRPDDFETAGLWVKIL